MKYNVIITDFKTAKYLLLIFGYFLFISCTKKNQLTTHPALQQIETAYVNEQYPLSYKLFKEIDTTSLTLADKKVWQLYQESFNIKKGISKINSSLVPYFETNKQYRYAGQAYVLQAICLTWQHKEEEAIWCLKQAENCFNQDPTTPDYFFCELYHRTALCYKADGLRQQGDSYSYKAIEYGKKAGAYMFVSTAYKNLANSYIPIKNLDSLPLQEVISLYDSALYYVDIKPNNHKGNYHSIAYNKAVYISDTADILYYGKYLIDTLGNIVPAGSIAGCYINRNQLDSAQYYLNLVKNDTLKTKYNKRRNQDVYDFLYADYLRASGRTKEASEQFKALCNKFHDRLSMTEGSRTYMISRLYDVEKAQREVLELKVEKQHLWIVVLMSIGVICLIALIFLIYRERWRRKIIIQEQQINALNEELEIKRTNLKQKLMQRIDFARQMNIQQMKDNNSMNEIPTWVKKFIDAQLLFDGRKGKILCQEFNNVYYNMLDILKAEYPDISQSELMMCVLIILQLSITDICVLLDMPRRTVWNKRNLIKEHIGLGLDDDLDQWLHNYAIQVALRSK